MILLYSPHITNRLRYTFNLVFRDLLGLDYNITTKPDEFVSFDGTKLNYSNARIHNELFICSKGLLFEKTIKEEEPDSIEYEGLNAIFPVYDKESVLPFDIFSAIFYFVTRYEEYFPYLKDQYNRYDPKQSLQYKLGLLEKPIVNIWAENLKTVLSKKYPDLQFVKKQFRFIPTIDIDSGYAYRHKGLLRNIGGFARALSKVELDDIQERFKVLTRAARDPFDTYEYQFSIHKKYNLKPIYFILFAEYGHNDKNLPTYSRKFHSLIKTIGDHAVVGIHPSFNSNMKKEKLEKEIIGLSKVMNREITKSRQHFLMLFFPETYRNLSNLDIEDDYTMGFASLPGFRAGICNPFYFYDLEMDVQTKLRLHPFTIMEGTLKDYLKLSAEEATQKINSLMDEVKKVKGTFISLWHNESLSDQKRWKGWRKVYEDMLEYATSDINSQKPKANSQ
jgi:hypothetical protein